MKKALIILSVTAALGAGVYIWRKKTRQPRIAIKNVDWVNGKTIITVDAGEDIPLEGDKVVMTLVNGYEVAFQKVAGAFTSIALMKNGAVIKTLLTK